MHNDIINMNRCQRCVIQTHQRPWVASPVPGVSRIKLEREDAESGQVTSIVRYEKGSHFPSHTHPNGEEIYVLKGTFEDEYGRYPAGTYLRNPPGSIHTPFSSEGCTILVKLNMFADGDTSSTEVDSLRLPWLQGVVDGLSVKPLHTFQIEHTALVKWEPGTHFKQHTHPGGEEIYVIDGIFKDEHGEYPAGAWIRNPPFSVHTPSSPEGCTILVKTGHIQ